MVSEVKRRLHEVRDVAVCGGGLTAIEAATEIAESNPGLRVTIYSDKPPGAWLSPRARRHVERAFRRMGIHVRDGLSIDCIRSGNLYMNDGSSCAFDLCIWAGGFTVPALAADSGLVVDARGRAIVDSQLRAIGHPEVYVIGDAASASGAWGDSIAYGCRTSGFQGPYVADLIRSCLLGGETWPFDFRYLHQCVSLGRRDAVIQFVHPRTEAPCDRILTGWLAVIYKEFVLRSAIWMFRHPGPYFWRQREASTVRNDEQRLASVREGDADDPRSWPPR